MPDSNLRKAAILLLSLPYEQRSQLLGRLESQQSEAVAVEMNALGEVGSAEREAVLCEFAQSAPIEFCRRPPEKTAPFQFLHDLETDALLELIADEQPQTVALILSCVPPQQAAAVLAGLTIEDQISLVCRIATVGAASPEVVRDVENALMRRLCAPGGGSTENRGVASLVRILNSMSPPVERRLLASLSETAPQFAQEIRRAMFGVDVAVGEEQDAHSAVGEAAPLGVTAGLFRP
jgi:flagellar motor switch protein FliG